MISNTFPRASTERDKPGKEMYQVHGAVQSDLPDDVKESDDKRKYEVTG